MSNEQMKNQLEDQHMDESQLNARRIKEAWQVMTLGQKIEYLWMYYKSRLAGALLIAGAIYLGITMYKGTHTEVLINITVVGGNSQQVEWLEESFAEYAGISPEDGIIKIQANLSADAEDSTSKIGSCYIDRSGGSRRTGMSQRNLRKLQRPGWFHEYRRIAGSR